MLPIYSTTRREVHEERLEEGSVRLEHPDRNFLLSYSNKSCYIIKAVVKQSILICLSNMPGD